jgi:fibronectin-binding autotransporter adhesin
MKTRFLLAAATLLAASSAHAADQTWLDANVDNTWSTSAPNWDAGVNWTNGNNAIFNGAGETITASGTPTFTNLTFGGNYIISGNTSLAAAGIIDVASGKAVSMGNVFGSKTLTKTGAGTLSISGAAFEGAISAVTVNEGTLNIQTQGFSYYAGGTSLYTVNAGATLNLNGYYLLGASAPSGYVAASKVITANGGTVTIQSSTGYVGNINLSNGATFTASANVGMVGVNSTTANTVTVSGTSGSTINGSGKFLLSGTQNFNVGSTGSSADLTVSAVIGDGGTSTLIGGVTKTGAGTMKLTAANTYTGGTTISAGSLTLANSLALQNTTLTYNTGGGTLVFDQSVATNAFTLGGLAGNANIALVNNATTPAGIALTVGNNNASTNYSGVLSGTGSFLKVGTGTLTLSGTNTYTGQTTVSAGTLSISSNAALGAVATGAQLNLGSGSTLNTTATFALDNAGANKRVINLTGAATIDTAASTTLTTSVINGNKALTKSGNGTLVINDSGINFTGAVSAVTVDAGTLDIQTYGFNYYNFGNFSGYTVNSGATLKLKGAYSMGIADGSGTINKTITLNNGTFVAQSSDMFVGDITLNNASTWTNSSNTVMVNKAAATASTVSVTGTGLSTIGGTSFRLSGAQKFNVADTVAGAGSDLTVSSIIANDTVARTGGFTKLGAGTMTLTGNNTYSAGTTITAGTLNAANNNVGARALGTGAVTINGGTLAINAATVGQVTLGAGATLAMTSGSIAIDITSAATFDKIVGGGANFSLTGGTLVLSGFSGFEGTGVTGNSYTLITGFATTGNSIGLGITGYDTTNWAASLDAATGTLTFTAVPEPSTYGLIGAGALAAVAVVRRRRKLAGKAA